MSYFEKEKNTAEAVRTKNNIFQVYYRAGRLKDGEDTLLDAMSQTNPTDTTLRVSILNNLGIEEKQRQLLSFSTEQASSNEFHTKLESQISEAMHSLPDNGTGKIEEKLRE